MYELKAYRDGMSFPTLIGYCDADDGSYDYVVKDASPLSSIVGYIRDEYVYDASMHQVGRLHNGTIEDNYCTSVGSIHGDKIYPSVYMDESPVGYFDGPDVMGAAALLLFPDDLQSSSANANAQTYMSSSSAGYSGAHSYSGGSHRSSGGLTSLFSCLLAGVIGIAVGIIILILLLK